MATKITYELGTHQDKDVIFIRFEYDAALIAETKKLAGARWNRSQKSWYVLDTPTYRTKFGIALKTTTQSMLQNIGEVNQPEFLKYIETLTLKTYSPSTIKTYKNEFAQLLYILKNHPVESFPPTRLRAYFLYCIETLELSENTMHSRINAVKFYYEQVLHRASMFFEIPRPKKTLPTTQSDTHQRHQAVV